MALTPEKMQALDSYFGAMPQSTPVASKPAVSKMESALRGASGGLGFGDEIQGGIGAALARLMEPQLFEGESFGDTYKKGRDLVRTENRAAREANPWTYGLANLASDVVVGSKIPLPAARAGKFATMGGAGGAMGYGYSDADTGTRQAVDTLLGVGAGLAGGYAGEKVGQGLAALAGSKGGQAVRRAFTRAPSIDDAAAPVIAESPAQKQVILAALKEGATPEEAAILAKANAFDVPLARGDVTRSPTQQGLEDFAKKGVYGPEAEAVAQGFRQEQQQALRDASKDVIGKVSGAPLAYNVADAGAAAAAKLKALESSGGAGVNTAYEAVKKLGNAKIAPQNFTDDFAPVVSKLRDEFPLDIMPRTRAVMERAQKVFAPGDGGQFTAPVDIKKIDNFRKFANRAYSSTEIGNNADKAGVAMLKDQVDKTVDRAIKEGLVYGNPQAINALKNAREMASEHFKRFRADDAIQEIVEGNLTPEAVVNLTRGYGKIGGDKQAAQLVGKLGSILEKDSPEFALLKQAQLRQVFGKNLDSLLEGDLQKGFNAGEIVKNLDELFTNNRSLASAYFTAEQQKVLKDFAEVAYRATNRVDGAINYSNTTPALLRWTRSFANSFGFLGRLAGAPVEMVAGGMEAIKKSGEAQKAVSGFAKQFSNPDNALALGLKNKLSGAGLKAGAVSAGGAASYNNDRPGLVATPPIELPGSKAPSSVMVPPLESMERKLSPEKMKAMDEYFQKPQSSIDSTISKAAQVAGVDEDLLHAVASTESALNPQAKSPTSSAKGLFQFTASTWKSTVNKYGAEHGIKPSDIMKPEANAIMASYLTRDNAEKLSKNLGRDITGGEAYTAHFMGVQGATKLLKADDGEAAYTLFPQAAKANKSIFFDGKKPRTVAELKSLLASKVESRIAARKQEISNAPKPEPTVDISHIPAEAEEELRKNPSAAQQAQFDEVFGKGAAAAILNS